MRWMPALLIAAIGGVFVGACGELDSPSSSVEVTEVSGVNELTSDVTVYRPEGSGPWPTAVFYPAIHSPRTTLDPFARELAAAGMVVTTVDYDANDLFNGSPECSQRFATLTAHERGGDPDDVLITGGHSLGAAVASMVSLFEPYLDRNGEPLDCGLDAMDLPPTDLVVGLSGTWHPTECDTTSPFASANFVRGVPDGFPALISPHDGNPQVPFLLAHGTDDHVCLPDQAEWAAQEWESAGHDVESLVLDGAGHIEGVIFAQSAEDWPDVEFTESDTSRAIVEAITAHLPSHTSPEPDPAGG